MQARVQVKTAYMRKRPRGLNHTVTKKSGWKERWFELDGRSLTYWDKPPAKGASANGSSTSTGNKKKGTVELATISDVLVGEEAEYGQENVFVIKYTDGALGTSKARREILLCIQAMDAAQRDDWIRELIGRQYKKNPLLGATVDANPGPAEDLEGLDGFDSEDGD